MIAQTKSIKETYIKFSAGKIFFLFIILCAIGTAIYSNTFNGEFVFDDLEFVLNNNYITDFKRIDNFWEREAFPRTRLLPIYSFAINYYINQLDVFGYHVFNFLIHIITATFVWWLAFLIISLPLFKDEVYSKHRHIYSYLVALIFLVHPIQTQAVTYITQRFASMATMFYIGAICFYVKGRTFKGDNDSKIGLFAAAIGFSICGMLSKEISITIPFMMLFIEYFLIQATPKKSSKRITSIATKDTLPMKVFIGIIIIFTSGFIVLFRNSIQGVLFSRVPSESHFGETITFGKYFLSQSRVLTTYLRLLFLPINQNLDYDFKLSQSFFEFSTFFGFVILLAFFWLGLQLKNKNRIFAFSIFWFFITLSTNFVPRANLLFEHKLYLVSFGLGIAICSFAFKIFKDRNTSLVVLLTIITLLSFMTYKRNAVWKTEISLTQDVVSKSPNKLRPNQNMGSAYTKKGYYDKALIYLNKALEIDPEDIKSYTNRGAVHYHKRNFKSALYDLDKATEIDPSYFGSYINRGLVYQELGQHQKAFNDFTKGLELKPNLRLGYVSRGNLFNLTGHFDYALKDFNQSIAISPHYDDAYNGRGVTYFKQGQFDLALADFNRALQINPNSSKAYLNRGYYYFLRNQDEKSMQDINRSIALNGNYSMAYNNRGILFRKLKQYDKSITDFNKSIQLNPMQANAYNNRATVYYFQQKFNLALKDYNQALKNNPNYDRTYNNRGVLFIATKQYDLAINDFTKALEFNNNSTNVLLNRASVHFFKNDYDLALSDYEKILQVDQNNILAIFNRGVVLFLKGEYNSAVNSFSKAVQLKSNFAKSFWLRSLSNERLGNITEAKKDLSTAKGLGLNEKTEVVTIVR